MKIDATEQYVFGVEQSISGKRWLVGRPDNPILTMGLAQQFNLPEIIASIISSRGIVQEGVNAYLDPKLNNYLPDPFHLKGMKEGIGRLISALKEGQKVAIFGDYDVDGATSSALLYRYFRALGLKIRIYIPDRIEEGYGPSNSAMDTLKSEGVEVVVTVDCGTTAHECLSYAKKQNLDVIVVDHHVGELGLPDAVAVINPNRLDEDSPHKQMAAVGVTFLLVVGLNKVLREDGYFSRNKINEPDVMQWLDLVALGTVADVVPLKGVNRALVKQGIKVIAMRRNLGLTALADVAELDEVPGAYHLGYVFGPRVNAGGRVGKSYLGALLLSTEDPNEAKETAEILDGYNRDRKRIEADIYEEALGLAEQQETSQILIVMGEGWHQGVIGIIASRLKERFSLPTCVLSRNGDTVIGSGRSISGVDLGSAVIAARQSGILHAGGGHAMAAGFSLAASNVDKFKEFISKRVSSAIADNDVRPKLIIDATITIPGASMEFVKSLALLGPFGNGNAEPRFAISNLRIAKADVVGKEHIRCHLTDSAGQRLQAISFRSLDTELGRRLLNHGGLPLALAGRLRENLWQGRSSVQLLIDDGAEEILQ